MLPMSQGDGSGRLPPWPDIRSFSQHAEGAGLDSVWVCDHFLYRPAAGPTEGLHEAWTIVSALAASTSRVEIGQLVMCASFRNPALMAKMAATADAVSGGRLILGLGAGWHDPEYEAYGYPTDHRGARFEEAIRITASLLRGERITLDGRYHQAHEAEVVPPPERRIPILVAAFGSRMLRLTARYADAWNTAWYGLPNELLRQRMADLDRALEAEGRDPATLRRTVGLEIANPEARASTTEEDRGDTAFRGSADDLARLLDAYDDLGFADAIALVQPMTEPSLDRLAGAVRLRG
jgi:alkanesulfonate monooxygenase SsuD/methylene tetrahydromethanopterin reductase-like flavin-dependent oxidoreductase (luciferase family)